MKNKYKSPMETWAEEEIKIAIGDNNTEKVFVDSYNNVLKAYKVLLEGNYSGSGMGFASALMRRLMAALPLTPIEDKDFFIGDAKQESEEYLKERLLKSDLQCPRMSSLFRKEDLNGNVTYNDVDRVIYHDIENEDNTWGSSTKIIDEMFPITMPYYPSEKKYHVYVQDFLTDKKNGDFDTRGYIYVKTPEDEIVYINRYFTTPEDGNGWKEISKEEYDDLLKNKRIDSIEHNIANHLFCDFIYYTGTEEEIEKKIEWETNGPLLQVNNKKVELEKLCRPFANPDNWIYNNRAMKRVLTGELKSDRLQKVIDEKQFLKDIQDYFKNFNYEKEA